MNIFNRPKSYRHRRPLRDTIRRLLQKNTVRYALLGVGVLIILGIILAIVTAPEPLKPEDTAFNDYTVITVGVATESPAFGTVDEEGNVIGFDADIARILLNRLYPDATIVFKEISSQNASYQLRNGIIDIAVGMLPYDVLKTQGLSMSTGYFTDGVYAYAANSPGSSGVLGQIQGKNVHVMISDVKKNTVVSALEEKYFEVELIDCSSYPDAVDSLYMGRTSAVIAPRYKMTPYRENLVALSPAVTTVDYRFAAWTANSDVIELLNEEIAIAYEDGTLEELRVEWDISETFIEE